MAKTKIEWCDYTVNPVKGKCPVRCAYCYAQRLYDRFHWDPVIRLDLDAFKPLRKVREPSRIFVGSTCELFGEWVERSWMMDILSLCDSYKRAGHTFLFLTKRPENLINWSPFPENCWVGVTATNREMFDMAIAHLIRVEARVKYISSEPLLDWRNFFFAGRFEQALKTGGINWLIIGQQTPVSARTQPKIEWVREIVEAADKAGVKVFLKDNLDPLLRTVDGQIPSGLCDNYGHTLRQEMPE